MVGSFDKIFKGRKNLPEAELRASLVSGGAVALGSSHGWNGVSLLAAPTMGVEAGAIVDSRWAVWMLYLPLNYFI